MCFVATSSDLYSTSVCAVMFRILSYIWSHYNGTPVYTTPDSMPDKKQYALILSQLRTSPVCLGLCTVQWWCRIAQEMVPGRSSLRVEQDESSVWWQWYCRRVTANDRLGSPDDGDSTLSPPPGIWSPAKKVEKSNHNFPIITYWLKFHWSLFPRIQLATCQHWSRLWPVIKQGPDSI